MQALVGPYLAVVVLLGVGGIPKIARPGPTVRALRSVGVPAVAAPVRVVGVVEVAVALAALLVGGRLPASLVAAAYLAFAAYVAIALRGGGTHASCGCFGASNTPPTLLHLIVNLAAGALAATAAIAGAGSVPAVLAPQGWAGVPFAALTGACVWFAFLALARLPSLNAPAAGAQP